jgi:flagellar hook-associated protein 1 FlgK
MSGTFSGFTSALSALRYSRVAMDVASSNVANAHTTGYTRRMAVAQATGAPDVPAVWSRWNGTSGGVELGGVERMVDPLLDARSRTEHASLSNLETRSASLVRFETTLGEPGDGGIAAALSAFQQSWHDVANNPSDEAARSQLLGRAGTLQSAVKTQAGAVATEWSDQRARLASVVEESNKVVADLAKLNGSLRAATLSGTDAGTLLDQRDQLALRLAQLTGAKAVPAADSMFDIELNGVTLVSGTSAGTIGFTAPTTMDGSKTGTVVLSATDATTGTASDLATVSGELGGVREVMNQDLPEYLGKLDTFVAELTTQVNDVHRAGYNLQPPPGDTGLDFFTGSAAGDFAVLISDPKSVAAGDGSGRLDASVAVAIAALDMGSSYRSLVTDFGVKVASARRVEANQGLLTSQVDATRESLSGVSIDEEMVNLLAAQRAYEGASRVITSLDSVLDTLINRTGLTR